MGSRVTPNSPKVVVKSAKSSSDDGEYAITSPLIDSAKKSKQPSESKKRNKLEKVEASIADSVGREKATRDDQMPTKAKSHFNLRRIFFKSQIVDERSNSTKSIETSSDLYSNGIQSARPVLSRLNHKSTSSLKRAISHKLSFAFSSKLLGKNLSRINSASVINANDVTTQRVRPRPRRDQSQSSLTETTDSEELQRVNRTKSTRFSAVGSQDELGQADYGHGAMSSQLSGLSPGSLSIKGIHGAETPTVRDDVSRAISQSSKINRENAKPLSSNSNGSIAIITRYSNYEECLNETMALLTKKGINCKANK